MSENIYRTDGTIDSFENRYPRRGYEIIFTAPEFTSMCPMTGQPDFGTITLRYSPYKRCIELRSYKFYLQTFRNRGIFYEDVVNTILDDVAEAIEPWSCTVVGEFHTRGGISARISASYEAEDQLHLEDFPELWSKEPYDDFGPPPDELEDPEPQ
jgi:7-cyano-7-deazaguanine reductase